jgi:hypothetical protein
MKQMFPSLKLMMVSSLVVAALIIAGLSAWAQTATTSVPTTSTVLRPKPKPTTSSDLMVQEACQRQKARTAKALQTGVLETFGSEEPFVFYLEWLSVGVGV